MKPQDERTSLGIDMLDAFDEGNLSVINGIISTGKRNLNEVTDVENWNWLHKILFNGKPTKPPVSSIHYLIEKGIPVNSQDGYGMTPLHYAMRAQNADAALVLLEAGADPNIANEDCLTPLGMVGGLPDRLDVLEMMLQKGGNVHYVSKHTGLTILEFCKTYFAELEEFKPIIAMMERYA